MESNAKRNGKVIIFKGLPALGLAGLNLRSTVKTERNFVTMKQ